VLQTKECIVLTLCKEEGSLYLVRAEAGPTSLLTDIKKSDGAKTQDAIVIQVPPTVDIQHLVPCAYDGPVNLICEPTNKPTPTV